MILLTGSSNTFHVLCHCHCLRDFCGLVGGGFLIIWYARRSKSKVGLPVCRKEERLE